jgi:hypothetical protein
VKGISQRVSNIVKEKNASEKFSLHETLQILKLIAVQPKPVRDFEVIK